MIIAKHKTLILKYRGSSMATIILIPLATFSFSVKFYMFFIHLLFLYYSRCISREECWK